MAPLEVAIRSLEGPLGAARQDELVARLKVEEPRPNAKVRRLIGFTEISGRAGFATMVDHDVVIAIDLSTSTFLPSGFDLDGDGTVGKPRTWSSRVRHGFGPLRKWTTDYDDTIVEAELIAAETLIDLLDQEGARVGIVTFGNRARIVQRVGGVDAAIDRIYELSPPRSGGDTAMADGIRLALRALDRGPVVDGPNRKRSIFLLADGVPTVPAPLRRARRDTLRGADRAAEADVVVHTFVFGSATDGGGPVQEIADRTGGRLVAVANPFEFGEHLPYLVPFTVASALESVTVENLSTKAVATAVRTFKDGSFDGYLRLAPGENVLRVVAKMAGGGELHETRSVYYEKPSKPTPADLRDVQELRDDIRQRTVETELAIRARRGPTSTRNFTLKAAEESLRHST